MMMKRHNQILAGILVLQVILSVVVLWPKSAATGVGGPLLSDLEADDIVALTIADADGNSISMRQVAGNWVLPDADDYPANADKITPFLKKVVGLTTARLVTRTDASHKRLQVTSDDFVRRIELETADGKEYALYLGSSPSYGATHFRLEGKSETYLTNDIPAWESSAKAAMWIDTSYVRVSKDNITRMTLENRNGTFTFTKNDGEDKWAMAGLATDEIFDEPKFTYLLGRITSIGMVAPLGKEKLAAYGMDDPNAVVLLEMADKTITLRVGAKDPSDNNYVVISSESPYYVRVSEWTVKDLVEKTRDDFLQAPPTPTPSGTPTAPASSSSYSHPSTQT